MKRLHVSWTVLIVVFVLIGWASISSYIKRNAQTVDIEQIIKDNAGSSTQTADIEDAPDRAESSQFVAVVNKEKKAVDVTFVDGQTVSVPIYWEDWEFYRPFIDVEDINFDGLDDLTLTYSSGAYNEGTRFYVQHPANRTFAPYLVDTRPADPRDADEPDGGLRYELGMFGLDTEKREASSYHKGRGFGDIYTVNTFKFGDDSWHIAQTEFQDTFGDEDFDYYTKQIVKYDSQGKNPATTTTYYKAVQITEGPDAGVTDFVEVTKAEAQKNAAVPAR